MSTTSTYSGVNWYVHALISTLHFFVLRYMICFSLREMSRFFFFSMNSIQWGVLVRSAHCYINKSANVVRVPVPPSTSYLSFQYPRDSRELSHFSFQYRRDSRELSHFSFQYPRDSRGLSHFSFQYPRGSRGLSHFTFQYTRGSRGLCHFNFWYPSDSRGLSFQVLGP